MKIIIITGPSCSGKTRLSQSLQKLFKNSLLIKTDSYYRDDILIRMKSIFIDDIYDRLISIKTKAIYKTISSQTLCV
jgi:uridine kinase